MEKGGKGNVVRSGLSDQSDGNKNGGKMRTIRSPSNNRLSTVNSLNIFLMFRSIVALAIDEG